MQIRPTLREAIKHWWNEETQCFIRLIPEKGIYIGLIEQMYNIKLTIGLIDDLPQTFLDGY